jgi:hypothetical protein
MTYKIEINCDNAAFDDDFAAGEIARILKELANNISNNITPMNCKLRDINGNIVGSAKMVNYE